MTGLQYQVRFRTQYATARLGPKPRRKRKLRWWLLTAVTPGPRAGKEGVADLSTAWKKGAEPDRTASFPRVSRVGEVQRHLRLQT